VSLYSQHKVDFIKATKAAPYKDPEPPKFVAKPDTYYLKIGQKAAVKIENKKGLIELFPDHKKEVAAFIKQNQTKLNKPEELIALVEYYNSL